MKTIKEKLLEYLDFIILLIILLSLGLFFLSIIPIHDCGLGIADYSCNMWGWHR
jgi:hypothetical protein